MGIWIERELDREPDPKEHDVHGIETDRLNRWIERVFPRESR